MELYDEKRGIDDIPLKGGAMGAEGPYGKTETPEKPETENLHEIEVRFTGTDPEITKGIKQVEKSSGEYATSILTMEENKETGENAVIAFFRRRDLECG